jgi:hypothetical protein
MKQISIRLSLPLAACRARSGAAHRRQPGATALDVSNVAVAVAIEPSGMVRAASAPGRLGAFDQ